MPAETLATDPAPTSAPPAFPLTAQIQSVLAQDVIRGDQLRLGGTDQSVALFINPGSGDVEALAIYAGKQLGWVRRDPSELTGWRLDTLDDDSGKQATAARVVVSVSPDGDAWAHYVEPGGHLACLRLRAGTQTWAFAYRDSSQTFTGRLGVAYSQGRFATPTVYGDFYVACWCPPGFPGADTPPWYQYLKTIWADQEPRFLSLIPGTPENPAWTAAALLSDNLVHLLQSGQPGDLGAIEAPFSERPGLVSLYSPAAAFIVDGSGGITLAGLHFAVPVVPPPAGATFAEFQLGYDSGGYLHIYLRDSAGRLWVLHQVGWEWSAQAGAIVPAWQQVSIEEGPSTTAALPIAAGVAEFFVLAQASDTPTLLVRYADDRFPELLEFRPAARDWARTTVRLPTSALIPAKRFLADVRLNDANGAPVSAYAVRLSADAMVEIETGGTGCWLGPQTQALLSTDVTGKISLATVATDIATPAIHLTAAGLPDGVVIQMAAPVHTYLAGAGSLPGRPAISASVLTQAQVDGRPLIPSWTKMPAASAAVIVQNLARRGTGLPPLPNVSASGEPIAAHRVLAQSLLPHRPAHAVFASAVEADAEWALLRAHADYAGVLDWSADPDRLGADLVEGIKNAIADPVGFLIDTAGDVIKMMIDVGGKILEFIITGVATLLFGPDEGPRLAAAFIGWLGARFNDLLTWLADELAVKDAWDTMMILSDAVDKAITASAAAVDYFKTEVVDDFFARQQQRAHELIDQARAQIGHLTLGQFLPAGAGAAAAMQTPQLGGENGSVSAAQLTRGPGTWFADKVTGYSDAFGPNPNLTFLTRPDLVGDPMHDLTQVWDAFCADMDRAGASFRAALDDLLDQLHDVLLPGENQRTDPAAYQQLEMTRLLDLIQNLIDGGLELADALCRAALNLVEVAIANLGALFDDEQLLAGGFIETIFTWVHGLAHPGEPAPKVTPLRLGLLMVAFPLAWATKITDGSDAVPFPHGFPVTAEAGPGAVGSLGPSTYPLWVTASVAASVEMIFGIYADIIPVGAEAKADNKKYNLRASNVSTIAIMVCTLVLAMMEWPSDSGLPSQSPFDSTLSPGLRALRFIDWLFQYWIALGIDLFCSLYSFLTSDQKEDGGRPLELARNLNSASNIISSTWSGVCALVSGLDCGLNGAPVEGWLTDFVLNANGLFQFLRQESVIEATDGFSWGGKLLLDLLAYPMQIIGCAITAINVSNMTATAGGQNQCVPVGTQYPAPLSVLVANQYQVPLPGQTYTFTAPDSGAGGSFAGASTATATTDATGTATAPPFTANGTAGSFTVQIIAANSSMPNGIASLQSFVPAASNPVSATAGGGQSTPRNQPFSTALSALVTNNQNQPVANVAVIFQPPAPIDGKNNPTASFPAGAAQVTVLTGSNGTATAPVLTANGFAGPYTVQAFVAGINNSSGQPEFANFALTNT